MMKLQWNQIVVALLIGSLVGAAAGKMHSRKRMHRMMQGSEKRYAHMLERFTAKLQLTPEQTAKVGTILENKRKTVETLRNDSKPKFDQIRRSTREDIRKLLTPEQQAKFDEMSSKQDERRGRWEKTGHH